MNHRLWILVILVLAAISGAMVGEDIEAIAGGGIETAVKGTTVLRVGLVQMAIDSSADGNCQKMEAFIRQAAEQGCRVVVFPESALWCLPEVPKSKVDELLGRIRQCVAQHRLYCLMNMLYYEPGARRASIRLLVLNPKGQVIQDYYKLWYDERYPKAPGLFEIDGIPCAAAICADRWIRSVEELPAFAGAQILFECSANFADEWIPELEWYWYVPRALRNGVWVVFTNSAPRPHPNGSSGHGHSAVISPQGKLVASAGEEIDKLVVADLDLSQVTSEPLQRRQAHPPFRDFWRQGVEMLAGRSFPMPARESARSSGGKLKIAAAQMACSNQLKENLSKMAAMTAEAARNGARLVVFPELALTGTDADAIRSVGAGALTEAVADLRKLAAKHGIYLVCGLPWLEADRSFNTAIAIDPAGSVRTHYRQLWVSRPDLFVPGSSSKAMWFEVEGIPSVITIGAEDSLNELAEMAAWRGALLHLHLANHLDTDPAERLLRRQLWVVMASFRTLTVTVNAAASNTAASAPSREGVAGSGGGSVIWDDLNRSSKRSPTSFAPYCAVPLAQAGTEETILYAEVNFPRENPQFRILTEKTNPEMTSWYAQGTRVIFTEWSEPLQKTASF